MSVAEVEGNEGGQLTPMDFLNNVILYQIYFVDPYQNRILTLMKFEF